MTHITSTSSVNATHTSLNIVAKLKIQHTNICVKNQPRRKGPVLS